MKKNIVIVLILIFILGVGGTILIKNKFIDKSIKNKIKNQTDNQEKNNKISIGDLFSGEVDVCKIFPKEEIEKMIGKKISETKNLFIPASNFTEYHCTYYLNSQNALVIRVREGNLEKKRQSDEMLGWRRTKDERISFEHFLAYDVKNRFRQTEFIIDQNRDIEIDFWGVGGPVLEEKEAIQFSIDFANRYLKDLNKGSNQNQTTEKDSVPLPSDEDVIRNFVTLIENGQADKAALMMKTKDDSELQSWAVHFSAINSFKLLKIEKASEESWTDNRHIYKVVLDVWMDPRSAQAPIPYYGWQNGENTRWITLEKVNNTWKIAKIATGP